MKELARKEVVVPHLNRWLRDSANFPEAGINIHIPTRKESDNAFHPSSDAAICARTLYAKQMGDLPRSALTEQSHKTFFFGHYFHGVIQHILVDLGFAKPEDIEKELKKYRNPRPRIDDDRGYDWWARGFTDVARVDVPGRDEPYLIDIKTMRSLDYRQQSLPAHLEVKYVNQIQLYLDWAGLTHGIILCCEKDSPHGFKEIPVEYDEEIVSSIYRRWDIVAEALRNKVAPDCDCIDESECPTRDLYV